MAFHTKQLMRFLSETSRDPPVQGGLAYIRLLVSFLRIWDKNASYCADFNFERPIWFIEHLNSLKKAQVLSGDC